MADGIRVLYVDDEEPLLEAAPVHHHQQIKLPL